MMSDLSLCLFLSLFHLFPSLHLCFLVYDIPSSGRFYPHDYKDNHQQLENSFLPVYQLRRKSIISSSSAPSSEEEFHWLALGHLARGTGYSDWSDLGRESNSMVGLQGNISPSDRQGISSIITEVRNGFPEMPDRQKGGPGEPQKDDSFWKENLEVELYHS